MIDKRFTNLNLPAIKEKYLAGDRSSRLARQALGVLCVMFVCGPSNTELNMVYHHPENYLKMVFGALTVEGGVS